MKTSVVLFDAGGVLFPANMVVGEELERRFGISQADQKEFWKGIYLQASRGEVTPEQLLDWFAERYQLPRDQVTEKVFADPFEAALTPMPGMDDLIERLAHTGVHIALLTDTSAIYSKVRDKLGFYKYFDKRFISCETGVLKPDPQAFQNVINHFNVPAQEIFFIDDNPQNIEAAKRQGMRGTVFESSKQLERVLVEQGILPS